jgi:hypothetical protein
VPRGRKLNSGGGPFSDRLCRELFALAFLLGRLGIRVGRKRGATRREIVQREREEEAASEIQRNVRQLTVVHGRSREEIREVIENAIESETRIPENVDDPSEDAGERSD